MLKIAICDDEDYITKKISFFVTQFATENDIEIKTYTYTDGKALIDSNLSYDLVFLDIEMDGMNGITAAETIRNDNMNVQIVFITSYSNYSMQAHRVHSFDFIEKPFEYEDIRRVLTDFRRIGENKHISVIELKTLDGIVIQPTEDIIYLMVTDKRQLYIFVQSQDKAIIAKNSLTEIYSQLDQKQFFMPHRSYIINLNFVKSIKAANTILMSNGDTVPLTRNNREKVKEQMHRYITNKGVNAR